MTFEEHYLCHKAFDEIEGKLNKLLKLMRSGEKISVKHIDLIIEVYNKHLPKLKNHLDEDFIRNTKTGLPLYFGHQGHRTNKDYWAVVKSNWTGEYGAAVKMFGKKWRLKLKRDNSNKANCCG